jgi:hypothetical protein
MTIFHNKIIKMVAYQGTWFERESLKRDLFRTTKVTKENKRQGNNLPNIPDTESRCFYNRIWLLGILRIFKKN